MSEWDAFPAVKPAASEWDAFPVAGQGDKSAGAANPGAGTPSGDDVSAISAAQALPIIGAYAPKAAAAIRSLARGGSVADNQKQIETDIADYQAKHPVESTVGNMAIGSLPYMVAGEFAGPAKLLGMTGSLPGMVTRGALSGAGIGAVDAAARGENPISGAASGFATGAAGPLAGRAIGATVRGVRNLVSPPRRIPTTVDLNGAEVPVPKSYVDQSPATQGAEEDFRKGIYGEGPQQVATASDQATRDATMQAARGLGDEMRGGPGPAQPQQGAAEAAGQTVTELAQQHNDAIEAQARHEAQLAAEGAGIRTDVSAPLGAPEQPETPGIAYAQQIQHDLQAAEQRAAANRDTLYQRAAQFAGNFHPAAFTNIGNAIRNQLVQLTPGARPVTINPQLTPNAAAMLEMLETRLGFQDPVQRGGQMPLPYPRPLTAADIEAARQEMVGHLQDARAVQARGGSGTDAYAAQRVMDAFDRHLNTVLGTPGAFSGDAQGYLQAIRAARQGHASYRNTFTNQRRGDNVGPTIQKITGAYNAEPAGADTVARSIWGSPSNPGAGNTLAIGQRLQRIFGQGSPQMQNYRQGLINHILNTPEGMEALTPAKQADRLQTYLQTEHAREFFTPEERTRLMQHAQDLRASGPVAPQAVTQAQRTIERLATGRMSAAELLKKVIPATGQITTEGLELLRELKPRVSQQNWNAIRQAVWRHLQEKPEGVTEWGDQALSQRIAKFLDRRNGKFGEGASLLYEPRELNLMNQFGEHYGRLAPQPGVVNTSNSANVGARIMRKGGDMFAKHIGGIIGMGLGHSIGAHAAGWAAGEAIQRGIQKAVDAKRLGAARDLFLGNRVMPELNPNYDRAAAILGHAARPVITGGP